MLKHLTIQNFAIIEHSEIAFEQGFTIITGETGAGKSILLGALSLILGNRADKQLMFDATKKTIVEGTFLVDDSYQSFFQNHDIDFDETTMIRRELLPSGKTRAFINDTPVTLDILKQLTHLLVDLHRQHESLSLTTPNFQRDIIDIFANQVNQVNQFTTLFQSYQRKLQLLEEKQTLEREARKQKEFISFQYQELEQANLKQGELAKMEEKLNWLEHQEELFEKNQLIHQLLEHEESGAITLLRQAYIELSKLSHLGKNYATMAQQFESAILEIEDIATQVQDHQMEDIDEEELLSYKEKTDLINRLMSKHMVSSEEELLAIYNTLADTLNQFSSIADEINQLEQEIATIEQQLLNDAEKLHHQREQVIISIEDKAKQLLKEVGMPSAQLIVQLKESTLNAYGKDHITILFSANSGQAPREIKQVASGGEMARLMLVLKSMIANKTKLSTMIFDEIDTGISGEIALKVGVLLQKLAKNQQIISITHLPQIASKGNHHLKIYKEEQQGITLSKVTTLTPQQRILEIAEMLSGKNPSKAIIQSAQELLAKDSTITKPT